MKLRTNARTEVYVILSFFFLLFSCEAAKVLASRETSWDEDLKVNIKLPTKEKGLALDSIWNKNYAAAYLGKCEEKYELQLNDIILENWNDVRLIVPPRYGNFGVYDTAHFILFADLNAPKAAIDSIFKTVKEFQFDTKVYQAYRQKGSPSKIILEQRG